MELSQEKNKLRIDFQKRIRFNGIPTFLIHFSIDKLIGT